MYSGYSLQQRRIITKYFIRLTLLIIYRETELLGITEKFPINIL